MKKVIILLIFTSILASCKKDVIIQTGLTAVDIPIGNSHIIKALTNQENESKYLVIFESGLGDGYSVWNEKEVANEIAKQNDVLIYSRAGYGQSTIDTNPRNIEKLRMELEMVINQVANRRKVILVAHSLGALIVRDFAIKNPLVTSAILFIDPSHENYNQPTQEQEDEIFNAFSEAYGANFGGTREARELIEDLAYISQQGNLPDVPMVVLSSMKQDAGNNAADLANSKTRQDWFNAHEMLKSGITDFTHIQTVSSGHYIMIEEPELVISNLNQLISKLP